MNDLRLLAAALASSSLLIVSGALEARVQRVAFRTGDGVTIAASWYEPSHRPAPAVILVHMLQRSRRDWENFASRLASSGIGALALDLRGHGESSGEASSADSSDHAAMVQDIRAARSFLATRADVQSLRIGIAGASIGANLAVLEAADDAGIVSLALLSPSLDYRGLRIETAVRKYGSRPILLVVGEDDAYARRSALELQKAGRGIRELLTLTAAGHGTNLLGRSEDLPHALVAWFQRTLQ